MSFDRIANHIGEAIRSGTARSHEDAPFYQSGNIFIKLMALKRDESIITHAHHYDHVTLLASGRFQVFVGESSQEYTAPAFIDVKAGTHHAILALEDSVAYCIHDLSLSGEDLGEPFGGH